MAEYIERKALLSKISRMINYCEKDRKVTGLTALFQVGDAIMDCPAVDVAPVVHGRWEFLEPNRLIKECMCGTCSVCKVRSKYIVNTMLCPNCGAMMDIKGQADV